MVDNQSRSDGAFSTLGPEQLPDPVWRITELYLCKLHVFTVVFTLVSGF